MPILLPPPALISQSSVLESLDIYRPMDVGKQLLQAGNLDVRFRVLWCWEGFVNMKDTMMSVKGNTETFKATAILELSKPTPSHFKYCAE